MSRQLLSAWAGRFAQRPASRRLIPWFTRHYGVDRSEALEPGEGFDTLQAFFTRRLRPGVRPLAADADAVLAPCDGTVGACGSVTGDTLVQAKGHTYRLAELVADAAYAAGFEGGLYATIYLGPADYHRVHAPLDGRLVAARYLPGRYDSVNPRAVASIPRLFVRNERMVLRFESGDGGGQLGLVMVGACLVGGIRLTGEPPRAVARGDEVAWFEFGSTVIVLADATLAHQLAAAPNQRLRMGEVLASGPTLTGAGPNAAPGRAPRFGSGHDAPPAL